MRSKWGYRSGCAALVLGIALLMVPVYWLVKSSLSNNTQLFQNPPDLFPWPPSLAGFRSILPTMLPDLGVSGVIALGCVVLTLVVSLPTAFGLELLRGQRGGGISRLVVLGTLMFPSIMFVIPLYNLLYRVHLLNTVPGLIIADSIYSVPLAIVVTYTYFITVPRDLVEAAAIDGAAPVTVFWRIVCPLGRPAIITSAIFAFLFAWGDYLFAVTFGAGRGVTPASIAISGLVQNDTGVTPWSEVMAGSVLLCVPALVVVFVAQRFISGGLTTGAVK